MDRRVLSPEMKRCLEFVRKEGGSIYRFPGGYWAQENWRDVGGRSFGTTTVEALISRGLLVYSAWNESKRFPIQATLYQEK